jgi:hypothetical protein
LSIHAPAGLWGLDRLVSSHEEARAFDVFAANLAYFAMREKVRIAREHASSQNPQAISFSAPTGSGKTVMMAALFEDIFFGTVGLPPQPDAAILWVSDTGRPCRAAYTLR